MTQSDWLSEAIEILRYDLQHIAPIPWDIEILDCWPNDIKVCERKNCWGACNFDLDYPRIFISPDISDQIDVLGTLVHELIHASVGYEHAHDLLFQIPAACIGLEGPLDATFAGEKLRSRLEEISNILGPYPEN